MSDEIVFDFKNGANTGENLYQPHHRKSFDIKQTGATRRLHVRPGNAFEYCIRMALFQRFDESGGEHVAGRFTGDNGNA